MPEELEISPTLQRTETKLCLSPSGPTKTDWTALNPATAKFPDITPEEIRTNQACGPALLKGVQSCLGRSIEEAKRFCNTLARDQKEVLTPQKRSHWENTLFATLQEILLLPHNPAEEEHTSQRHTLLNHLGRKDLIRAVTPEQGLTLAIQALRLKDTSAFKKIIFNFKKHPKGSLRDKPVELLTIELSDGRYLGHLAAQIDCREAIQYIACNYREILEKPDHRGETLVHTASRHQSGDTIQYLLGLSKRLFGRKNHQGETPLDLESGPIICRSIAISVVEQDVKLGEETLRKALAACKAVQEKKPIIAPPPSPHFPATKLEMERIKIV